MLSQLPDGFRIDQLSQHGVKQLSDICLQYIGENLETLHNPGRFLPTKHKELLLERLVFHDQLTEGYLPHVTYNLFSPALRSVNLFKSETITDHVLAQLAKSTCKLHHLKIEGCPKVTDKGILNITKNQSELITLELSELLTLTSKGLMEIKSAKLRTFNIAESRNVTNEGVASVVRHCPSIRELVLLGCSKLDDSIFPIIATYLGNNLEILNLARLHVISDESLQSLAKECPNLKMLNIDGSNKLEGSGVQALVTHCKKLQSLDLSYCRLFDKHAGASYLLNLPASLYQLSLCGILLSDEQILIDILTSLTGLTEVRLCGVPALTDNTIEKVLSVIGSQIESLDLSGGIMSQLTDEGMTSVTRYCTKLQKLFLTHLRKITCKTLTPILHDPERVGNIEALHLDCRDISPDFVRDVAVNCHNLRKLIVAGLGYIDDEYIKLLALNCPKLSCINLKGCTQVTDTGVCQLARSCPITYVVLAGLHRLTDSSIFALANSCPYLEEIYLNGCAQVTPWAVRYLLDCCIPRVYVRHKIPNAPPNQLMAKNLDTGEYCRADLMGYT